MFESYLDFLRNSPVAHSLAGIVLSGYITFWVVMFLGWYFKRQFYKRNGEDFMNSAINQSLFASTLIASIVATLTGAVLSAFAAVYGTLGVVCLSLILIIKLCCVMIELRNKIPEE
ncbi:hypothetical protein vBEcoMphAPEC6_02820 [Escherichia phage ph0011]|nr:hypothetical protein vBEcoMphAPEC6_02820 [Escherichia phage ph0011]